MFSIEDDKCDKCGKSLAQIHPWPEFNCYCPDESYTRAHADAPREKEMDKPYIKLDQDFPGIVSLFMYDREVAKNLTAMGQTIMRRARSLSVGERELIASFVSKLNECQFCYRSHKSCTEGFLNPDLVNEVLEEENVEVLSYKMRALLIVAMHVQNLDRAFLPDAIADARRFGANDQEIHDTVLVAAFFSMCNRYVDGLGTTFNPGEPEQGGKGLVEFGYTMGIRRFFREVLPKMWSKFWS